MQSERERDVARGRGDLPVVRARLRRASGDALGNVPAARWTLAAAVDARRGPTREPPAGRGRPTPSAMRVGARANDAERATDAIARVFGTARRV